MQIQMHRVTVRMRIMIDMVYSPGIKGTSTPDKAMDFIPLRKQQLSQVRAILTGNSGD
jgi:hypothetical protein